MSGNDAIIIRATGNGFIVETECERNQVTATHKVLVFQSFAALSMHLSQHFTHRDMAVPSDFAGGEK